VSRAAEPFDERTRTAYHEAGHAVLGAALDGLPHHVSIREDRRTAGRTEQRLAVGPASRAQIYLAGFAAEHLLTGRRPRQLDAELGLGVLAWLDPELASAFEGIEASDGYRAVREVLRTGVRENEGEIRREVERLYEVARGSLSAVWSATSGMASALLEMGELDRSQVERILGASLTRRAGR
jgi:ATP-dependent Zn protease